MIENMIEHSLKLGPNGGREFELFFLKHNKAVLPTDRVEVIRLKAQHYNGYSVIGYVIGGMDLILDIGFIDSGFANANSVSGQYRLITGRYTKPNSGIMPNSRTSIYNIISNIAFSFQKYSDYPHEAHNDIKPNLFKGVDISTDDIEGYVDNYAKGQYAKNIRDILKKERAKRAKEKKDEIVGQLEVSMFMLEINSAIRDNISKIPALKNVLIKETLEHMCFRVSVFNSNDDYWFMLPRNKRNAESVEAVTNTIISLCELLSQDIVMPLSGKAYTRVNRPNISTRGYASISIEANDFRDIESEGC